jgi:DNA-3-methyladenine glycosylase I
MPNRCSWAGTDELFILYHDREWGVPVHDDRKLFEMLILEGAQAGLSWSTVLKKRDAYRQAFEQFDPVKVAAFAGRKIKELMDNPGIIRNRLKIESAVKNARACLEIQREFGSFNLYIWKFTGGKPIINKWKKLSELPARTVESDAMSKDLKKHGLTFVGSTICYAFMQAVGMVNDHVVDCFRYGEIIKAQGERVMGKG